MFVKASDAVSCPLLSLVFADRSLLGADYDDANCISQIVKNHFSDLARCISQIVKKHFLDLANCISQIVKKHFLQGVFLKLCPPWPPWSLVTTAY